MYRAHRGIWRTNFGIPGLRLTAPPGTTSVVLLSGDLGTKPGFLLAQFWRQRLAEIF